MIPNHTANPAWGLFPSLSTPDQNEKRKLDTNFLGQYLCMGLSKKFHQALQPHHGRFRPRRHTLSVSEEHADL